MSSIDFGALFAERFPAASEQDRLAARSIGVLDPNQPGGAGFEDACRLYLRHLPPAQLQLLVPSGPADPDVYLQFDFLRLWGFFRIMRAAERSRQRAALLGGSPAWGGHLLAAMEWFLLAQDGIVPQALAQAYSAFVETALLAPADRSGACPAVSPLAWLALGRFQYENPFAIFDHRDVGAFTAYDSLGQLFSGLTLSGQEEEAFRRLQRLYPGRLLLSRGETARYAIDYIQSGGRAAYVVGKWLCGSVLDWYGPRTCDEPDFFRRVSSALDAGTAVFSGADRPAGPLQVGDRLTLHLTDPRGMPFDPTVRIRQVYRRAEAVEARATAWYQNRMWLLCIMLHPGAPERDHVLRYLLTHRELFHGHQLSFPVRAGTYPHACQAIAVGAEYDLCLMDLWGRDVPLHILVSHVGSNYFTASAVFPDNVVRDFTIHFPAGSTAAGQDMALMEKNRGYQEIPYPDWQDYALPL